MTTELTINGLIKIALANGMVSYTTGIDDGPEGLTAACILHLADDAADQGFTATMAEAMVGRGMSQIWLEHPRKMLEAFVIRKAISTHFKYAVEAFENALQ